MGRKPIYEKSKTQVGLYLDEQELEVFDEIMWREKKTRTQLAHIAVTEYIKNHAEGNDTYPLERWHEDPTFQAVPALKSDQDKWIKCYKNSTEDERTQLRIQAMNLQRWFRMVDVNEKVMR